MFNRKKTALALTILVFFTVATVSSSIPAFAKVSVDIVIPAPVVVISVEDRDMTNFLLWAMLANLFDVDVNIIVPLGAKLSFPELIMVLVLARESRRPINTIIALRNQGIGWGVIAQRLGVHPGVFNQARVWSSKVVDKKVEESMMVKVISDYYGIPEKIVQKLRDKRYPPGEIVMALNLSEKSGKPLEEVLKMRSKDKGVSWKEVGQKLKVKGEELKKPVSPKEPFGKIKGPKVKEEKGKGEGKAVKGKGKGKG